MAPLPCEWNWQVCIDWYVTARSLHRLWSFKKRALRANRYDSSCHEPPKLLHFNGGPQWKAAFNQLDFGARGAAVLSHNLVAVQRALDASRSLCIEAERTLPGIASRACNVSFLLQRHATYVAFRP